MGGAPGTRETDLLKPGGYVRAVQAIVLSGGSAYGLDAAGGRDAAGWRSTTSACRSARRASCRSCPRRSSWISGAAANFKKRPDAEFGYRAADAATNAPVKSGRDGVGMGAGWGMGTASVKLSNGYTVAAIVGLNPAGSPVDAQTCLPTGTYLELANEFNLVPPRGRSARARRPGRGGPSDGSNNAVTNTTIALIATDAPLLDLDAERMATIANAGLARTIRPIHGIGDGDTVFGMATTMPPRTLDNADLQAIFNAAADVLGRAVIHAVIESKQVGSSRLGYCQQYPSACVKRTGR